MSNPFQSIRFRLTVFYVLIFFVILTVVSFIILWNYHGYLMDKAKNSLRDKSFVLGAWINFTHSDYNHQAEDYVRSQESEIMVRLIDRKGNVIGQSLLFPQNIDLPEAIAQLVFDKDEPVLYETEDGNFLIAVNNLFDKDHIRGLVQVVQSKESILASFWYLVKIILYSIGGALLLSFVGGIYMVDQMLSPLNKIIRTVNDIQAEKISSARLSVYNPNDELGRLSFTVNSLLERIEKAMLNQRKFVSDAAHELRTPLTILKGNTEVAMIKAEGSRSTLSKNLEEINSLIALTNDLLMMARFDNDSSKLNKQRFCLSHLIIDSLGSFESQFSEKQINLFTDITDELYVQADSSLIKRSIYNILDNAIKYIGTGKNIHVRLYEVKDGSVVLSIKDEGIGIPKEKIEKIFDRFYRVNEDRNKDIEGTGLGLAIVKSIMELHQFNIQVESELNKGTIITITI